MPEISDIRRTSRGSHRRRVYLDGYEWRSIPAEVVSDLGLRVGQECEPETLSERIAVSAPARAWERALRLMNFRERGSGELTRRLLDDGYDGAVVEEVVSRARDLGFLDDRRFAEGLARAASAGKRRGRRRVAAELAAKGVDDDLAAEVLGACCDDDSERERAFALARSLVLRRPMPAPRLASRLVSRGFETALAWRVAREVAGERDGPSDEE